MSAPQSPDQPTSCLKVGAPEGHHRLGPALIAAVAQCVEARGLTHLYYVEQRATVGGEYVDLFVRGAAWRPQQPSLADLRDQCLAAVLRYELACTAKSAAAPGWGGA